MGGACCKPETEDLSDPTFGSTRVKTWKRQKWRSDEPITESQLQKMREEFWDTEPHYGGDRVIWDALKAACAAEVETARIILDSAGVIVAAVDMSVCYDERGRKYELPKFVICDPVNLSRDGKGGSGGGSGSARTTSGGGQLELPAVAAGVGNGGSPGAGSAVHDDVPLSQVAVR